MAVMHRLVGPSGLVVGVDHLNGLVETSRENLRADGVRVEDEGEEEVEVQMGMQKETGSAVKEGTGVKVVLGDGRKGYPPFGQSPLPLRFHPDRTLTLERHLILIIVIPLTSRQPPTRPSM
jgi:protein-L-isoaspartate O-methyltransferase